MLVPIKKIGVIKDLKIVQCFYLSLDIILALVYFNLNQIEVALNSFINVLLYFDFIIYNMENNLSHCVHINEPHFTKKLIKIINIKKKS